MEKYGLVWVGVKNYSRVCQGVGRCKKIWLGVKKYGRVCVGVAGYKIIWLGVGGCEIIRLGVKRMAGCENIYLGAKRYGWV